MSDQADQLRSLVIEASLSNPISRRSACETITVSGGKRGVGTTTCAVNLAVALAGQGRNTILIDGDPSGGDVAALCGLRPTAALRDVVDGRRSLGEVLSPGPSGIRICAGSKFPDSANFQGLIDQLLATDDVVAVIDAGNGCSAVARQLWPIASPVLITTTDSLSLMDTYVTLKSASREIPSIDPRVVINKVVDQDVASYTLARLRESCERFLGRSLKSAGSVPLDPRVITAASYVEPFLLRYPDCEASTAIGLVCRQLVGEPALVS